MKLKKIMASILAICMVLSTMSFTAFAADAGPVAKVGNTEYATIDEAIANWTNGTTLTLLANVTLSDVVTLKSTEHHILDLGTYTMTAASGKNAFVIKACGTGSAERSTITINADATSPGGINAGSESVVYYNYADGGITSEDRPTIKINGGVFTGSTSNFGNAGIYTIGTAARKCATVNITGGTFNCSILGSSKSKLIISGGTFNYSVSSQGDSTCLRLISGGTFKTIGFMTADANNTKFWIGTSMGNSNVGVYVDDDGYIVVGGPVITEAGTTFEASASYGGASSYLQYSSAKTNGLYYTSAAEALIDNNETSGVVNIYVDKIDMEGVAYKGTIVVPEGKPVTIINPPSSPAFTVKDTAGNELKANSDGIYSTESSTVEGVYVEGADVDVKLVDGPDNSYEITLAEGETWTDGDGVKMTFPAVEGATGGDSAYVVHQHGDVNYIYVGKVNDGKITFTNTVGFSTFTVYEGGLEEALAAAEEGDTITLLSDVEISNVIVINKSITLDGNGHKFTPASDFVADGGHNAVLVLENASSSYIIKNLTFEGFSGLTRVVRVNFCDAEIENCIFKNNNISGDLGGVITSSYATVDVKDCTFDTNTSKFAIINIGSDVSAGTDVVANITGSTFVENSADIAVIYLASTADVTDSYFNGNIHTGTNENAAAILAGPYTGSMNYTINITENAFDNAMSKGETALPAVFAEDWSSLGSNTAFDLSSNYWDGVAPAETVDYKTSGSNPDVTLEDYYTTYENGTLGGLKVIAPAPVYVATVNGTDYETLEEAFAAAEEGDEIILLAGVGDDISIPADVTFNGNGFAVSGTLKALGDISFAGHTKVAAFDVENVGTEINIGAGACLEITGTGRMVIGHGCIFNIEGNIENAKTANIADLAPSLIMPGASFTGAGVTFNVKNAYIKTTASYCSSSKTASGTFDFNIENSIWEQFGKLAFESQSTAATVNFDLKDSVLTTTSHLVFGVSRGEIVIDNSNVNVGKSNQIENQSRMTIKNGSVVNGAVATSSNAINPGTIIVEDATYAVSGQFSGAGVGTGTLIIKKGANVSVGSIVDKANIVIDATGMTADETINFNANLSKFTGTVEVINNDALEAKIVDGKIVLAVKPVAQIGDTKFTSLQAAIDAAQDGDTITLLANIEQADGVTITDKNLTIDLSDYTFKVTEGSSTNSRNFLINGNSVVAIKNGTLIAAGDINSGTYGTVRAEGTANVTLSDLKLYNYRGNGLNIKALTGTTVHISDTDVYSTYGGGIEAAGATIELTNVNVYQKGLWTAPYNSMAISVNGGGTVIVNSGIYSTEPLTAEDAYNQGSSHGSWAAGVLNSGGTLIINGGTFTNGNYGEDSLATAARGLILADTGANIQINGGTFNALKGIVDIQNNLGDASKNPTGTITGGTFSADPTNGYVTIADGYAALPNLDGGFVVGEAPTATVNNLGAMTIPAGAYYIYDGTLNTGNVDMPLNFVMQFVADQDAEDMKTSPFANWYADFVITFEGIENGSFDPAGCYLAGYYGSTESWDGMWVKIPVDGLLKSVVEGTRYPVMMGVGMGQEYDYICSGVQAFSCAMFIPEEILEANPDLKVNLELNVVDSSDDNKALEALQTGNNIYKASETSYTADDFSTFVAQIGDKKYKSLEEAFKAATAGCTIEILDDVTIDYYWDSRYTGAKFKVPVTIDGNGHKLTFTAEVYDGGNQYSVFRFEDNATVIDLTIDMTNAISEFNGRFRAISAFGDLTVDGCTFIGNGSENNTRAIIFGEKAGGDPADHVISITNSTFNGWRRAISDNENGKDVKSVTITGNAMTDASIYVSAHDEVVFNNNTVTGAYVNIKSYTFDNTLDVTATGNTLTENTETIYNVINAGGTINAQDEFVVPVDAVAKIGDVSYESLEEAIAAATAGETVILLVDTEVSKTTTIAKNITLDLNGKTISGVCATSQGHLFMVSNGACLTIKDSSAEQTGKITYTGNNSTGWIVDVEGKLILESGTLELTGTWSIGYAVDVRPNAWGTAYTEETAFVMNGGKILSSDGAVRVASSSADSYSNIVASFTMNDGEIEAACDGVFVQQSDAAWDVLNVTINNGTIKSDLNPVRFYGLAATSYVNGEDCVNIALNGGTLTYTGTEEQTWMVENILRLGGGVTAEDFLKDSTVTASESFAEANVDEGYKWVESNGVYTLEKEEVVTKLFKVAGTTTSLDSSLALNFYLNLSDLAGDGYYAVVEHTKATGNIVETTIPYTDWENRKIGQYDYKAVCYTGIAAKEMADTIKMTVYNTDGTQASVAYETSLRDYALDMMNDISWRQALIDMLNYGAAAQIMFNYNTENLANADTDNFQQYASKEYELNKDGCALSEAVAGTTLTLEDMIKLNVYFENVTDGMYATYSYTTHAGTLINERVEHSSFISGWGYKGVSVGVAIADAATLVTVTLYDKNDVESGKAIYSVNAYLKDMIDGGKEDLLYPELAEFAASAKKAFAKK